MSGTPPSGLSYQTPMEFVVNTLAMAQWPTVTGSVVSYSIRPDLPAGLFINTQNGAIAGTPTVVAAWATYTVTASNPYGSITFDISLAVTGPSADGMAPTIPGSVTVTVGSPTELDVAWAPSTDNVAVTGYHVYRDGALYRTLTSSPLSDAGLPSGVQHCYAVSAFDAWRNESPQSTPVCGTPAHRAPVAVLSAPASTLTGTPVTFDASQSRGVDGAIVSYQFDFGDGSALATQATPTASHTYAALGTFTVTLTVTDNAAATATAGAPLTAGLVLGTPVNVSNTTGLSQTASAFREADGSIDVVWEEGRWDLLFARSTDGGHSFTKAKYVIDPAGTWGSQNGFAARQMQVVAGGGVIHVTESVFDQIYGGSEIFYMRSTDAGATFSAPLMVSTADTYGSYIPSLAADGDGSVFIAWRDDDEAGGPLDGLYYAKSADSGVTFSTPASLVMDANALCPAAVGSSALVTVVWPKMLTLTGQMFFAHSGDGAKTFSAPIALDEVTEHVWCPKVARDASGVIYATWEEDAQVGAGRILLEVSTDGGATFSPPLTLSPPSQDATVPSVAAGPGGRVFVTWIDVAPGLGVGYLAFSSDSGRTFSPPLRIDAGPLGPGGFTQVLAVDSTHLALVTNAPPSPGAQNDIFYVSAQISPP